LRVLNKKHNVKKKGIKCLIKATKKNPQFTAKYLMKGGKKKKKHFNAEYKKITRQAKAALDQEEHKMLI